MAEGEQIDGGPAFACAADGGHQSGMTLRDYFAGQALMGIMAQLVTINGGNLIRVCAERANTSPEEFMSNVAYKTADAMLRRRAVES